MVIDRDQDFHSLSASLSTYAQPLGRAEDGDSRPDRDGKKLGYDNRGLDSLGGRTETPTAPPQREAPSLSAVSPCRNRVQRP